MQAKPTGVRTPAKRPALTQGEGARDNQVGKDFCRVIRDSIPLFQKPAQASYG